MKYLFLFLFICPFLFSCTSVPVEYLEQDNICNYKDSIFYVSKNELILDNQTIKKIKESKGNLVLKDDETFQNRFYIHNDDYIINKQTNKQLGIG